MVPILIVIILIVIILIAPNIVEKVWLSLRHSKKAARTSRVATSIIGIIAGFIGAEHGGYEIVQRERHEPPRSHTETMQKGDGGEGDENSASGPV